jgi:hypothetical protein
MSLYRQVGRSSGWLVAAVVIALLVGLGLGFAVARATADEPSLEDAVSQVQADAATVSDALELVGLHYATTKQAARDQLERAEELFAEVEPELRLLAPEETAEAETALQRLETLIGQGATPREVEQAADEARAAVRRAARLR